MRLGWRPPDNKFGRFDILPLVLQANGKDPEFFIIPEDLILEVHLTHPELVVLVTSCFVSACVVVLEETCFLLFTC